MSETPAPVVFISHHSSRATLARALKAKLAQAGIRGWMAPDDIDPGVTFDQAIIDQLARSDAIALLFCGESDQSRHVKRELMLGEDGGKAIYPVRLENVTPKGLAYWLQDYQWIDWIDGKGSGADRLIETIQRNAGQTIPEPASATDPSPPRRKATLTFVAAALVLLAVGAMGWYLFGTARPPAPARAQPDFVINPGKWIGRRNVIQIVYPEVAPAMARQMEQALENDPDPEECIPPEVARAPGVLLFDPGGAGHCTLTSFRMSGGQMSGYLSCPLPGQTDGSVMQVTFRGRYTRTAVDLDNDITISRPGSLMRLRARDTSRYVGPACSRPPPPAQNGQ